MSFKIGQKVVCVKEGCADGGWVYDGPVKGEICKIDFVRQFLGHTYLVLEGYNTLMGGIERVDFNAACFRPVDETFGEEVTESLEQVLKEQTETISVCKQD